jgi:hypothetical protein
VEICLIQCESEVREVRKKAGRGNMRPATVLGERVGKKAIGNLPELLNITFKVLIHRMQNGNNDQASSLQL